MKAAPDGGTWAGGGLENRDAACAGKLKDRVLSLQSDGEPLKAAGWGRARTRAGHRDQHLNALARAGRRETGGSRRGPVTVLAASSEASGGQWPWKGATFISGVHLVAYRPGQGWAGSRSLGTCLWACPRVRSPHPSHRQWPCSCAGVHTGSRLLSQSSC